MSVPPNSADDVLRFIATKLEDQENPVEPGYDVDFDPLFEGVEKGQPSVRVNEHINSAITQRLIIRSPQMGMGRWYQLTENGVQRIRTRGLLSPIWQGQQSAWEPTAGKPVTKGQGRVWRVKRVGGEGEEVFALKEMKWIKTPDSTAFKRFRKEIEATAHLSETTPGIVQIVDFGFPENEEVWRPFYVMPWADSTLAKARDLRGDLERVLVLVVEVARALETAHDNGIIHRDIKPENILLIGDERNAALADFGICYVEVDDAERVTGTEAATLGSDDYVAPELLGGGRKASVDARADIYSLGKTLYAAVAGMRPFPLWHHDTAAADLALRFGDNRLHHLHGLLRRMVTELPDRRFASMRECRTELERALQNVRQGIAYEPGMYEDLGEAAVERGVMLLRALRESKDPQRTDAVRQSLDRALRTYRRVTQTWGDAHPGISSVGQLSDDPTSTVEVAVDHLLAVGIPLLENNELDWLVEWQTPLANELAIRHEIDRTAVAYIRSAVAVVALYGIAAVAWSFRRIEVLEKTLAVYEADPAPWVHVRLPAFNTDSGFPWVREILQRSRVLSRLAPESAELVSEHLDVVAALVCLRSFAACERELTIGPVPAILWVNPPAALYPENGSWPATLARVFQDSPETLHKVAMRLFNRTPAEFRSLVYRLQVPMQRLANKLGMERPESMRDVQWFFDFAGAKEFTGWAQGALDSDHRS